MEGPARRPFQPPATTVRPSSAPVTSPTARVVDDVLHASNPQHRYSYDVTFPKLQRIPSGAAQDALNAEILAGVTAATDEFIDQVEVALPSPESTTTGSTVAQRRRAENFTVWNLNEQPELVIMFPSYQVGPRSSGTPTVIIPIGILRPIRNPDGPLLRRA